jgi:hypothetical protein
MAKRRRRPCPRGLFDGCPIPRELCTEDYDRTGEWHCLELLKDFEAFIFPSEEDEAGAEEAEGGITTLEDLVRALEEADRDSGNGRQ